MNTLTIEQKYKLTEYLIKDSIKIGSTAVCCLVGAGIVLLLTQDTWLIVTASIVFGALNTWSGPLLKKVLLKIL